MRHHFFSVRPLIASALATGLIATVASGCGLFGAEEPKRDASGTITESADADVFALKVGDCVDSAKLGGEEATEISSVGTVPCGQPHDGEVFAETTMATGDFPGDAAAGDQANEYCKQQFESFIGVAFDDSVLDLVPMFPTSESWTYNDDRVIQCVVIASENRTGTMKDSEE